MQVHALKKKIKHYLNNPKRAWNAPVKKVTVNTSLVYNTGSTTGFTTFETMADINNETTATGPIASSRDVPIVVYIKGGTTLVSMKV